MTKKQQSKKDAKSSPQTTSKKKKVTEITEVAAPASEAGNEIRATVAKQEDVTNFIIEMEQIMAKFNFSQSATSFKIQTDHFSFSAAALRCPPGCILRFREVTGEDGKTRIESWCDCS